MDLEWPSGKKKELRSNRSEKMSEAVTKNVYTWACDNENLPLEMIFWMWKAYKGRLVRSQYP